MLELLFSLLLKVLYAHPKNQITCLYGNSLEKNYKRPSIIV